MSSKTVVHINVVSNFGSTGKIALQIADISEREGWKPYMAFGRKKAVSRIKTIKIGSRLDKAHHLLATRFFDSHGLHSVKASIELVKNLEAIKPSIIHLHNIHGYYLNYEVLFHYIKKENIPVIWSLHDCWSFTGHCTHFEYIGCEKWKTKCYNCELKTDYPKSWFLDRSTQNFFDKKNAFTKVKNLTLVPVSEWLGNLLKDSFLNEYPIRVIGNGIALKDYESAPSLPYPNYLQKGKKILLGVASVWTETKGLNDFIKLASLLKNDEQLVLVGLSKSQIAMLPKNVTGIARTENKEALIALYYNASVFLNFTYADTYPTTNIEAMAAGTPVVAYRTGGCTEMISKTVGKIVNVGDLVGALAYVRSEAFSLHNRENIIEYTKQYFDAEKQLSQYVNLYEEIISK